MVQIGIVADEFVGLDPLSAAAIELDPRCTLPTCLTTGSTHGFALSSRYAPMPKSTFLGSESWRYAAINLRLQSAHVPALSFAAFYVPYPKRGSSGAWGQTSFVKDVGVLVDAIWPCSCWSRLVGLEDVMEVMFVSA